MAERDWASAPTESMSVPEARAALARVSGTDIDSCFPFEQDAVRRGCEHSNHRNELTLSAMNSHSPKPAM